MTNQNNKLVCQICNQKCATIGGLASHISRTHHISSKEYYDNFFKHTTDGICKTCGKPTNFLNLNVGYFDFCSNSCVGNNPQIQEHKKITTYKNFGVDYPMQSKEILDKAKQSNLVNYGVENSYQISSVKEKALVNSHTEEANEKRKRSIITTKQELYKDETYKQAIIEKTKQTNLYNYGVEWTSQVTDIKEKISNSVKKLYENPKYLSNIRTKYEYNGEKFDSSYELALYIYAIDHNEHIIRKPCRFKYMGNDGKSHTYTPDFSYKEQLVEIKGDCFLQDGKLYNMYNGEILSEKQSCMEKHNVKLITYSDIQKHLQYCIEKYKDKYWYRRFKK